MLIIKVQDLLRHKDIIISAPEESLEIQQKILLKSSRESLVAEVLSLPRELPGAKVDENFRFDRILSEKEFTIYQDQQTGEQERLNKAQQEADKLGLSMKFFASRVGWDKKATSLLFTSDNPVDFRELLKTLPQHFIGRLQLHRTDPRDRAEIIGGIGSCGREECCIYNKLTNKKVSLDAVRDQGIMIKHNPKIYDVSGKLKRCMLYELDEYRKYRKYLPHIKQEVSINQKKARVLGLDILNGKVKVIFTETDVIDILPVEELEYPNKQIFPRKDFEFQMPEVSIEGNLEEV